MLIAVAKFTERKEIVCTGGHPFYVVGVGFVEARNLKTSDKLLLSNGNEVIIEKVEVRILAEAETTYNFEVADFHTYYVSEKAMLVHNKCTPNNSRVYSPEEIAKKYNITVEQFHKQVKSEILRKVKPNYKVGNNPDIALNRIGDIAYQGAKGSKFAKGFQDTGLNIIDIINSLGLGG